MSILHAARACSLTGEASETAVDVCGVAATDSEIAGVHLRHLLDASARRIHLSAEHPIGRAVIQAESAMDALGIKLPCGTVGRRRLPENDWRAHTANLPRLSMSFGSSARRTSRIQGRADSGTPQISKRSFASLGQYTTCAWHPAGSEARKAETVFAYCMDDAGSVISGMKEASICPARGREAKAQKRLFSSAHRCTSSAIFTASACGNESRSCMEFGCLAVVAALQSAMSRQRLSSS